MSDNDLIDRINDQAEIVYRMQRELAKEKAKLNRLWTELQDKCEHVWVADHTQYDPCRTMYVCEICKKDR
jgi:ribosomal protein L2